MCPSLHCLLTSTQNAALHDSLSLARTNKAQMKALLEDLQTTLHTQSEDYLSHIGDKDQQISELTEQVGSKIDLKLYARR